MTKSNIEANELTLTEGHVSFGYEFAEERKNEEEQTFSVPFHSLQEMLELVAPNKSQEFAAVRGAKNVWVDSVGFIAKSEDENTQVETLLMEDENYVELLQRH